MRRPTLKLTVKLAITDGMVPGEAQFEKEVGLPSWFSTVVCQG